MTPEALASHATAGQPSHLRLIPARTNDAGSAEARPAFLVLAGGGYDHLAGHEGEPVAQWLAGLGIHAGLVRYPTGERHPAPLASVRSALDWLHSGAPAEQGVAVDTSRVGVIGFSAGGHLAAHTVTTLTAEGSPLTPSRLVLCYAVVALDERGHSGSAANLLGPGASREELLAASPVEHITPAHPPTFVWHTADDGAVPVLGVLDYTAHLVASGVEVDLHVFAHGRHGLGLARPGLELNGTPGSAEDLDVREWTGLCARWLERAGWARGTGSA